MSDLDANLAPQSAATVQEGIAQWKNTVQDYFSGEWANLRELIRELEEHDWDNATLKLPEEDTGRMRTPFHTQVVEQLRSRSEPTPAPVAPTTAAAPPENSRLADLAKRLEDRLKRSGDNA